MCAATAQRAYFVPSPMVGLAANGGLCNVESANNPNRSTIADILIGTNLMESTQAVLGTAFFVAIDDPRRLPLVCCYKVQAVLRESHSGSRSFQGTLHRRLDLRHN